MLDSVEDGSLKHPFLRARIARKSDAAWRQCYPIQSRDVEHRLYVASSTLLDIPSLRFRRGFKAKLTMPDMPSCVSDIGTYSKIRGSKN